MAGRILLYLFCIGFVSCSPSRLLRGHIRHDIIPKHTPAGYLPNAIERLVALDINGVKQWLLIRGHDLHNPIMLSLHGGPGFPNMWNIESAGRMLEHDFTVVYWEQRGTMKSWNRRLECADLTLEQLSQDVLAVSEWLIREFQQPQIYLRGESFGTVPGILAVVQRPDLYRAYIANSQLVEFFENEAISWQFADSCARANNDRKAIKRLAKIHTDQESYTARQNQRLKGYVGKFGGWYYQQDMQAQASAVRSFVKLLKTPEYSGGDIWNVLNHPRFSAHCMRDDARQINLFRQVPRIEVPIFFISGRYDKMTPSSIAYRYFEQLEAPKGKYFIWYEQCAHAPMFEEPMHYYHEILRIHHLLNGQAGLLQGQ